MQRRRFGQDHQKRLAREKMKTIVRKLIIKSEDSNWPDFLKEWIHQIGAWFGITKKVNGEILFDDNTVVRTLDNMLLFEHKCKNGIVKLVEMKPSPVSKILRCETCNYEIAEWRVK